MNKLSPFEEDILNRISLARKENIIHLDKEVSAEMYSAYNRKQKRNQKQKQNTFQQSTTPMESDVNVGGYATPIASQSPSAPGVKEDQRKPESMFGRKLSRQDLIVDMNCCLNKIRTSNRYLRMTAYFSVRTDVDTRYMIFLRAALTTAHDEILRSINLKNNKPLLTVAEDFIAEHPGNDLMLGRIRYTPKNNKTTDQHRHCFTHGLFAVWTEGDGLSGELYLNGEYYPFIFTTELTPAQAKVNYRMTSTWLIPDSEDDGFID